MPKGIYTHKPHSLETREKMSIAGKNKIFSDSHRENISNALRKRIQSEESKNNISKAIKSLWRNEEYRTRMINKNIGRSPWNKGKEMSLEYKIKASEAKKGIIPTNETRLKMSKSHKGKCAGNKSHFWKGGISIDPYSPNFDSQTKERVRVRDNFICQMCGIPELECEIKLHVHHIDYDKMNSNIRNLVSLCVSCHAKTNHNREYWKKYFEEKGNLLWRRP